MITFASVLVYSYVTAGSAPDLPVFIRGWETLGAMAGTSSLKLLLSIIVGMWTGAASHTVVDIAVTYIKTGRVDALF